MSDIADQPADAERYYSVPQRKKVRRVVLATLLCGIAASILVSLISALLAFIVSTGLAIFGVSTDFSQQDGVMAGAFLAVMLGGLNWYFFFIVIPVTWLVLFLSLGRLPGRGIASHRAYYRWGMIWGALLVGGTTGFFGMMVSAAGAAGALLTGLLTGAASGYICAALFLAIVRPKQQLGEIETDVF